MSCYQLPCSIMASLRCVKTTQESAGKAQRRCSASSLCHTCCCSGARRAHTGAPAGWSCKLCRSTGAGGRNRRQCSRPASPLGRPCSWSGALRPRSRRSWACCGAGCRQLSGTNTRCTWASGPKWSRSPRCAGIGPSGGWLNGRCSSQWDRGTGRPGRGGWSARLGGRPGRDPAEKNKNHLLTPL